MRILLLLYLLTTCLFATADTIPIPIQRVMFHDRIEKERELIDKLDGKKDRIFKVSHLDDINLTVTDALYRKVDQMRFWVEQDSMLPNNNHKVKYLSYIEQFLKQYRSGFRSGHLTGLQFTELQSTFFEAMQLNAKKESYEHLLYDMEYDAAKILSDILVDNPAQEDIKAIVYLKYCHIYPEKIMPTIKKWANHPFADSLLLLAAKANLAQVYTYAQSENSVEGKLIHKSEQPLVKAVASLSQTPLALFYFPFLDDIMSRKKSIDDIKKVIGDGEKGYDSVKYFKLLVETEIEYFKRMTSPERDTPIAYFGVNGLRDMLQKKAIQHFITPINELHDLSNIAVRMKAIEPLNAQELYYVLVMGEQEIYTSSYKHAFTRLLQLMGKPPRGDELLASVHFDHFRKFIKMAAHYNRLDTFLKTMPQSYADVLMKAFVANLDKSNGLEDAVDVADAYSSIHDPVLLKNILSYIEEELDTCKEEGNTRGTVIYSLLKTIFHAANSNTTVDLTNEIGIPSIYTLPQHSLRNEDGKVIQQVFFYGDEDGKAFFPAFVSTFNSREWKVVPKKEWIEFIAHNGKMEVYVNRPLDSDQNLDDSAQVHLIQYLEGLGKYPTMVVHRGHSYWLPRTISRMSSEARIVLLGSCGGFKNLNQILEVSPDAHIISTKEIGRGNLNQPINNYLNNTLLAGKDIDWREMWKTLSQQFQSASKDTRESWEDYIPPYRNLGAIFIKAYHLQMQED